jgi:hypothetical protein
MSTYAEERIAAAAAHAAKARKYVYRPTLMDRTSPHLRELPAGRIVVKVQPYGCPRNGTMGMCYVGDADTGAFIGMVCEASLVRA